VQVPLPGCAIVFHDPSPGTAAEYRLPIVRRETAILALAVGKVETRTLGTACTSRKGSLEPLMIDAAMVGYDIHQNPDAAGVGFGDQLLEDLE